jgi:predicted transcriptional regulator
VFGLGALRRSGSDSNQADIVKLFFDTFSKRLVKVEDSMKTFSAEIEKLRLARDRSQISDLVLLERLEKLEGMVSESLDWIKRVAVDTHSHSQAQQTVASQIETARGIEEVRYSPPSQRVVVPTGTAGSFQSVTTPTELQVLSLLADRGSMSAPEVGRVVGRSREHSARLMRKLFDEGYLRRDQARIPFRYSLVDRVLQSFKKAGPRPEGQEVVSVPQ